MSPRPLFLERSSYRRRRLGDAARILPILGLILLFVPVWWFPERLSLTGGALWLFGFWAMLIGLVAALHRALGRADHAARLAQGQGRGAADDASGGAGWDDLLPPQPGQDDEVRDDR